jgi:predicted O-methyltransferase YrrM
MSRGTFTRIPLTCYALFMERFLQAILPKSFLQTLIDTRDRMRLASVPRQTFNHANLGTLDPGTIFSDRKIEDSWNESHEVIKSTYGDDDRFGGINPGDRRALYFLIRALKPENVLEVGTHIGASTLYIARALKAGPKDGRVTTVDLLDVNDPVQGAWKQFGFPVTPKESAARVGCLSSIEFVISRSLDYMNRTDREFDFIFLDGDHSAHTVYLEVTAALRILAPGGLILLHDYYPHAKPLFPDGDIIAGPFRALARIARENPGITARPIGSLPWPTKQGSHVTSLALVTKKLSDPDVAPPAGIGIAR